MAIFHCQTAPLGRSAGRSAVAAAAYRSGAELSDERTGELHDYRRRSGVESADIVVPAGAPAWAQDRGKLWNAAEAAEARKDARTAREWVIALPAELGERERRALALEFAGKLAERYGVAVDVAIHAPGRKGDDRNHHAHLLATTRRIGPDGLGAKAHIEQSDKARKGQGLKPARTEIEAVRAEWAGLANRALERAGAEARIDHRTLAAQGIDREPTRHLGPAAAAIERERGRQSRRGADHAQDRAAATADRAELRAVAAELKTVETEERASFLALNRPPPDPERVFAGLLDRAIQGQERAAAATLEQLRLERERWGEALEAHRATEPAGLKRMLPGRRAWEEAGAALDRAGQDLGERERIALQAVHPAALKAAALDELRRDAPAAVAAAETARQEREAREQAALKLADEQERARKRERKARDAVSGAFKVIAFGRERGSFGYGEHSAKWRALPKELKERVEEYNKLPQERRDQALERIGRDPRIAELMKQAKELEREKSRSQGRSR